MGELEPNHASVGDLAYRVRSVLAAALLSVALAACGGGGDGGSPAAAGGSSPGTGVGHAGSVAGGGGATATGGGTVVADSGAAASGTSAGGAGASGSGAVAGGSPSAAGDSSGIPIAAAPGATTLSWTPPTLTEEGAPLKLTGYRIYWSQTKEFFPYSVTLDNPGLTRYVVEQLAPATWYFVATALSDKGESEFSNVIAMQVL